MLEDWSNGGLDTVRTSWRRQVQDYPGTRICMFAPRGGAGQKIPVNLFVGTQSLIGEIITSISAHFGRTRPILVRILSISFDIDQFWTDFDTFRVTANLGRIRPALGRFWPISCESIRFSGEVC